MDLRGHFRQASKQAQELQQRSVLGQKVFDPLLVEAAKDFCACESGKNESLAEKHLQAWCSPDLWVERTLYRDDPSVMGRQQAFQIDQLLEQLFDRPPSSS